MFEYTPGEYVTPGPKADILTGRRFGLLVALGMVGRNARGNAMWECACNCGSRRAYVAANLKNGNTASCGCPGTGIRGLYRDPIPQTYLAAHNRTRLVRGKASTHPCIDCGHTAADWSLIKGRGTMTDTLAGRYVVVYSPNPEDYEPRCKKCHAVYDRP